MGKTKRIDVISSATIISLMLDFARDWSKKSELNSRLASAMIYAGMAEFIADALLLRVKLMIMGNCRSGNDKSYSISFIKSRRKQPTNLEYLIPQLETFTFPHRKETIPLFYKIKDSRNKLFHNILPTSEKEVGVDGLVKNIRNDVEKLIDYWMEIMKDPTYKSYLKP